MGYTLNENQLAYIQGRVDAKDYSLAYRFIAEQVQGAVDSGDVSHETQRWFEWATEINGNYDSFINNYARTFTRLGALNVNEVYDVSQMVV